MRQLAAGSFNPQSGCRSVSGCRRSAIGIQPKKDGGYFAAKEHI